MLTELPQDALNILSSVNCHLYTINFLSNPCTVYMCTQKKYSSQKTHAIWLAVDEEGTSLLERSTMECLASYRYSEVSTFGSHGDDFMLVVSPHHNSSDTGGNLVEKLLLVMPKVKVKAPAADWDTQMLTANLWAAQVVASIPRWDFRSSLIANKRTQLVIYFQWQNLSPSLA